MPRTCSRRRSAHDIALARCSVLDGVRWPGARRKRAQRTVDGDRLQRSDDVGAASAVAGRAGVEAGRVLDGGTAGDCGDDLRAPGSLAGGVALACAGGV